ncbi:hypothetical protein AAULR_15539 [Lacticaseibacillus rhamnosus MTCC 5462]|nr:hypothetical protein AAULR_15539 [Lacticaseibacillus rhamnosus MTCC 5462]
MKLQTYVRKLIFGVRLMTYEEKIGKQKFAALVADFLLIVTLIAGCASGKVITSPTTPPR